MGLFRLLVMVVIIAGIAGVALYFGPDEYKEKTLSFISGSPYIPGEVKKIAEDIYETPALKRKKLLAELNQNLGSLRTFVDENSEDSELVALVDRTQEIVDEVLAQNTDPTIIKQITDSVTAKLLKTQNSCPTP